MSNFWDGDYYVKDDSLNETIWTKSPQVQVLLQDPALLRSAGLFGAQQAMNDPGIVTGVDEKTILPWVPDLVGRNSCNDDGLLVVGHTYAGFIKEYSLRPWTLPLGMYHGHMTAGSGYADFQKRFVKKVVSGDPSYYERIGSLLGGLHEFPDASHITLFDLCRASFVLRGTGPLRRRGDDSQGTAECCWPIFQRYVENPEPRDWLWRRINESSARRIVALGRIAEHGLLRLFDGYNLKIHRRAEPLKPWRCRFLPHQPWVKSNAEKPIEWWLEKSDWWEIGTEKDRARWRLLPIKHPNARSPDYTRLPQVLSKMIQ